jgi:hypothetical protein
MQDRWVLPIAEEGGISPLQYMLAVVRDPKADTKRRDTMALAAAPYCHPKVVDRWAGKREIKAHRAKHALAGSPWAEDLSAILDGPSEN